MRIFWIFNGVSIVFFTIQNGGAEPIKYDIIYKNNWVRKLEKSMVKEK